MAKLSERLGGDEYGMMANNQWSEHSKRQSLDSIAEIILGYDKSKQTKGETNMTLRTINLTLVDNNPNLKGKDKIVFQKLNYVTEHNDDQSIQQILMTGRVSESLETHNYLRSETIDKDIQRNTGRDVMLEDVEIFDLDWMVVRVA